MGKGSEQSRDYQQLQWCWSSSRYFCTFPHPALRQIEETSSISLASYWSLPNWSSAVLPVILSCLCLMFHCFTCTLPHLWSLFDPFVFHVSLSLNSVCSFASSLFLPHMFVFLHLILLQTRPLCQTPIHSFSLSCNLCTDITPYHKSDLPLTFSPPSGCSSINQ